MGSGLFHNSGLAPSGCCDACGEVIEASILVGTLNSLKLKGRTRTSDRRTAHAGLSTFRLPCEGEVVLGVVVYLVVLKGLKKVE